MCHRGWTVAIVALILLGGGCRRKSGGGSSKPAPAPPPATGPAITVNGSGSRIIDPKLSGSPAPQIALTFALWPSGQAYDVQAGLFRGEIEVRRLLQASNLAGGVDHALSWDGRDDFGACVDPGPYTIRITRTKGADVQKTDYDLVIVRLGVTDAEFVDTGADTEHDLTYFKLGSSRGTTTLTSTGGPQFRCTKLASETSDLDLNSGLPRSIAAPNSSVASPEMDGANVRTHSYNRPIAYVAGTRPRCTVTFGTGATSEQPGHAYVGSGYPDARFPIRARPIVDGIEGNPTAEIGPGLQATVDFPQTLPAYVTKGLLTVDWVWEYQEKPGQWVRIPGRFRIQHVFYTLLGVPVLRTAGVLYQPWVAVLDRVATWTGPATDIDTSAELITLIDQNIFLNFGVQYDSAGGGRSMYTANPKTNSVTYQLGAMMDGLAQGTLVNCLDCAATTTTFCNMVGIGESQLLHIQGSYTLNYIEGIGRGWTKAIFMTSHTFGWHEVSTIDLGATVIDNSLNVDIDGNPAVTDAPNAIRGWNINRTWASYQQLSKASGTMTPFLDSKPILRND